MKRLITTLAILLVVVVTGMTALVMLVNPNDFRDYMAQQVAKRSGYQLSFSGDLRWHVWPRLSILTDQVSLTAPGATLPAVTAENMRLDVDLFPLFSHQLKVSQVLLKNAVIRDIPAATGTRPVGAPVAPQDGDNTPSFTRGWSLDINHLNIADSLFIWQDAQGNQINFRDLNLDLTQDEAKQGQFQFSSHVSRNQQSLALDVSGRLNASHYPQQLTLQVSRAGYQVSGVDLPAEGITGDAAFDALWQPSGEQFSLSHFRLTANNSDFAGDVSGQLSPSLVLQASLSSENADFDRLLAMPASPASASDARVAKAPVIADSDNQPLQDSWLRSADMTLNVHADKAVWHGLQIKQLVIDALNRGGVTQLRTLSGRLNDGHFSVPGQLDWRGNQTRVNVTPDLQNIDLQPVLAFLQLPPALKGELSLQGQFTGNGLSHSAISHQWQGEGHLTLHHAQTGAINLPQMVGETISRNSGRVQYQPATGGVLPIMSGDIQLTPGVLNFNNLRGNSSDIGINALGKVDFSQRSLDVTFNLSMTDWKGDQKMIRQLSGVAIPVRFYGSWDNLQYSLPVTQVLNGELRQHMKERINSWLDDSHKKSAQ